MSKHMGNLIKPKGKPKKRQSFLNKILELATASPTNLILKILPLFRLLWIGYSIEFRLLLLKKYNTPISIIFCYNRSKLHY